MSSKTSSPKSDVFLTPEGDIKSPQSLRVPALIGLFLILVVMGAANLYSASSGDFHFYAYLKRITVGLIMFGVFGWVIPIRNVNHYGYWFYGIVCVMLSIVLVTGHIAGGSQRWLHLGFFVVQPSEFAKLAVAVIVAKFFFSHRLHHAYQLRDLWPLMLLVGFVFGLIFDQPDLGTAGVCLLIAVSQIAFVRLELRSITIVSVTGLVMGAVGWFFFLHDYQRLRILNLVNPNLDPSGSGYNSIQSLVAVGSGGIFGKGYLAGTQSQLQFLPARHTDFIFSVFAEEHGFWAGALVFIIFGGMAYLSLEIARRAHDSFSCLLSIGIGAILFVEFAINIAMVLGLFPVVGVPLPFFSYGGSSLITLCIAMGLLVAVDRQARGDPKDNKELVLI